jgi:DNA-binding MarR family transcriptional regulator
LKVWKNGKTSILEAISAGGKTWTEIKEETGLSRPVISEHLKSLLADGLIVSPPGPKRGSKYEVTPNGQESLLRERNRQFDDENSLFLSYDLHPEPPEPRKKLAYWAEKELWKELTPKLPEQILQDSSPTFPTAIKALLVMDENGKAALDPWAFRMLRKYGYIDNSAAWIRDRRDKMNGDTEWIDEEVAWSFADPTIKKLCEVLFERTRVLCQLNSSGEKSSLPTMDNILNFNFQFICRYEGGEFLNSASKEERISAQHRLAGMLLLYLGGGGSGPMETFSWDKQNLEALVKSGLLTQEEIQPLLETCKPLWRGLRYEDCTDEQKKQWDNAHPPGVKMLHTGFYHPLLEDLTDEQKRKMQYDYPLFEQDLSDVQKRKLTISAYKRFYLADQEAAKQKKNEAS